jgi:hypothetical protein
MLLCLVTMPLTLVQIVYKSWAFGEPFCKLTGVLEPASMFVSTLSITVIAIDRCYVIQNATAVSIRPGLAVVVILLIWAVAVVGGIPLYFNR